MSASLFYSFLFTLWVTAYFPTKCQVAPPISNCSKKLSGTDHGTIYSPDSRERQGKIEFCNYAISVSAGKQVALRFGVTYFESDNAYMGVVLLFDGADCMSERIAAVDPLTHLDYISTGRRMTVLYISDVSSSGNFRMQYDAVTGRDATISSTKTDYLVNCGEELAEDTGAIAFRHPHLGTDQLCIWRIIVSSENVVKLNITTPLLPKFGSWLRVLDGGDCGSPVILEYVNSTQVHPPVLTSTTNEMTVVLSTVGYINTFFEAFYYSVPSGFTNKEDSTTNGSSASSKENFIPSVNPAQGENATTPVSQYNEKTASTIQVIPSRSSCSKTLTGTDRGNIQSPNYPQKYGRYEFCNYAISVSTGNQVSLEFGAAYLELGASYMDFVLLFDGADCMSERLALINPLSSETYISTGSQMTALFIADVSSGGHFLLHYNAVSGQKATTPTPNDDILVSCKEELTGNFGNIIFRQRALGNDQLCIWRITVPPISVVKLNITLLDQLERYGDWLRVLDGADCGAPAILTNVNSDLVPPTVLTSTTNVMTVVLSTLGLVNTSFEASYYSAPRSTTVGSTANEAATAHASWTSVEEVSTEFVKQTRGDV